MSTLSVDRLAKVFVEVADTLVTEFDLIEFMQLLADRVASMINSTTVGLLLADPKGQLRFMAASDETTKFLEIFQLDKQDGPCVDAFQSARPVVNTDLRAAVERWPQFAPRATAVGFLSVHAFPLRLRNKVIGALGVFGTEIGDLDDTDVQIVQALADVAAIALLQERTIRRGEVLTEQLQGALNSRIVIEQAKGATAQAHGVTVDEAFEMIRGYARRTGQRLGDVARLVVTEPSTLRNLDAGKR
ncbi:MAG: GAF and ANTAR domain-containing protein [Actinoplanes sp.]